MTENRPQFGEKAPEGWQNPLQSQQVNQEANAAGQPVGSDAETTPQQLNGVPHNLGGSARSFSVDVWVANRDNRSER